MIPSGIWIQSWILSLLAIPIPDPDPGESGFVTAVEVL